jgi:2-succinyl-6-hydroxy-2,4-cyclohexadiene-1-carboxylate synthase
MLWCLHGFLGRGTDWDVLRAAWPADLPDLRTPELFAAGPRDASLVAFGERFAGEVAAVDPSPMLLGYSLGGRLALHALLARPGLWRAAVIVSAHLGLPEAGTRDERRATDAAWAERFRIEDWTTLLAEWNARDVFGGKAQPLARPESAFSREALAEGLETWSVGNQADLRAELPRLSVPILWIAGAEDHRYVAQAELALAHGVDVRLAFAPGAGHRVPWEAPEWFAETVMAFIRETADSR